ncbi:MAG: translation elongation factor Ts [Spirochaetaceae bacterium]|jgi:elongation factor Ts|nr:translation elongation factor Ts [Spirochaetaceae bacterium]
MAISVSDVKKLREKTGAGPADCKKALEETSGDFAQAEKLLKEKGLAAVEKRADRATKEGKIFVRTRENTAAVAEITTETDFVAKNPEFIALGEKIADIVLEKQYAEVQSDLTALVTELATKIGENMSLKRIKLIKAGPDEYLTHYIHGDGNIGVVVKLSADKPEILQQAEIREFAHNLALHIAAFNPLAVEASELAPSFIKEQEEIFRKLMQNDESLKEKPANALENILKGKMKKYLAEICLLDQGFVKDDKLTVAQVLGEYGKKAGGVLKISACEYFRVGQ